MKTELNPLETPRKSAFEDFKHCACPTIVATKVYDVTRLLKFCRRHNVKFNAVLCWLMGKVAGEIDVFYTIYEPYKLLRYDSICINIVVDNPLDDAIFLCDVPFSDSIELFLDDYNRITKASSSERRNILLDDHARLGTSAVVQTEFVSITGGYNDKYTNPFLTWGRYHRGWFKTTLPITLRVNHIQMDGAHVARFMERLQQEIYKL